MPKSAEIDLKVRQIILIEGGYNFLVLVAKAVIGISTGSMSILGDAIHSLADLSNNIIAWIVIYFSSKPADREHPYGHRKIETLAVFFLATMLVVLSIELVLNAVRNDTSSVSTSGVGLVIMIAVLVLNISISAWQHIWARRLNSDIILADAKHTLADVLITIMAILGWQLSVNGYAWADRLGAILVALAVIYLAYTLFRRTLPVLLDAYAIPPEEIKQLVENIAGVRAAYQIRTRWVGSNCAIDLIIAVDPALSTEVSHEIANRVESEIQTKYQSNDISIHVEPFQ